MTLAPLADATWREAAAARLLILPVGSLEQHGPHLPLDTDTTIAVAVAEGASSWLAEQGVTSWVAPAIAYGASGEHQHFAGTVSIGTEALHTHVVELVRSARTWADRVVLVNGHGGNAQALTRAVGQLRAEGHDVAWLPCRPDSADLHAGYAETSLMLHLRPSAVQIEHAQPGEVRPLAEILLTIVGCGIQAVSPNGVLGDPRGATAEAGKEMLAKMVMETGRAVISLDAPVGD